VSRRVDAGKGTSLFLLSLSDMVINKYPRYVANVGIMQFYPGNTLIVPEHVDAHVEFRCLNADELDRLENDITAQALKNASTYSLALHTYALS
jgi:acetylornithine deacetylase/succinyl-diaminopimelate desuccinylase-like protein